MLNKPIPQPCFHGGAAYRWIGEDFEDIACAQEVIDADVLDAWFEPSPNAIQALRERLPWAIRCSPPVVPSGVQKAIARAAEVPESNLVCGSGSSALIFLALREILSSSSRVLILDPTYGEYAHVVSSVVGCGFDSFDLSPEENYIVDLERLSVHARRYDLVVIVNPNNPTGQLIQRDLLEAAITSLPQETIVWLDEAYIDYAGSDQSLAGLAAISPNVIVCKSLSKVLALSGLRAAYLVGHRSLIERLRLITPPWSLSLPAQMVVLEALKDRQYYQQCYSRTHQMRDHLSSELRSLGFSPFSSTANFLLVEYPFALPAAEDFLALCSERNLLLRDVRSMGKMTFEHSFRVAVKDVATNGRIIDVLKDVRKDCLKTGS
jgi:histidinol-phosphate/aromatic aminotransferase/cobyric acid decarboxylase-like protein